VSFKSTCRLITEKCRYTRPRCQSGERAGECLFQRISDRERRDVQAEVNQFLAFSRRDGGKGVFHDIGFYESSASRFPRKQTALGRLRIGASDCSGGDAESFCEVSVGWHLVARLQVTTGDILGNSAD